jgi:hypothetical protein
MCHCRSNETDDGKAEARIETHSQDISSIALVVTAPVLASFVAGQVRPASPSKRRMRPESRQVRDCQDAFILVLPGVKVFSSPGTGLDH